MYRVEEGWCLNRRAVHAVITDVLPRLSGFDPGPIHVRFVVDQVALERILFRLLGFSPVIIFPPMFHVRLHINTNFSPKRTGERRLETFIHSNAV